MNNPIIPKLTSFAVASAMLLLIAAVPAEAAFQDNSGDLDFGRNDSASNTLLVAGGAIAIGVGVWAIVRHSKKKKRYRLEQRIIQRRAELLPAGEIDAVPSVESPAAGEPWLEEAIERMANMRAADAK